MTKEEMIAEVRRRRLVEQVKQKRAAVTAEKPVVAEPEKPPANFARGLAQSVTKGSLSGFGDEAVGAARAAIDYASPDAWGSDAQSWADKYKMYRDDERESTKQFEDENKGVAIASNLAGSFANPLNKLVPGSSASALQAATKAAGVGALQGAVQGAGEGEGDLQSQLESALQGARMGAGFGAAGSVVGNALGKTLSNQRVQDALWSVDASGNKVFKPISLASPESGLGKFYRDAVGVAYGGGNIGKQESQYLQKALKRTGVDTDSLMPITQGTRNAAKDVKGAIQNEKLAATSAIDAAQERNSDAIKMATKQQIATKTDEVANDIDALRKSAAMASIPDANVNVLDGTDLGDPQSVYKKLKNFWNNDAFRVVKDKPDFQWDSGIQKRLREAMESDAAFKNSVGSDLKKIPALRKKLSTTVDVDELTPAEYVDALLSGKATGKILDKSGKVILKGGGDNTVDGDVLMEIRNVFARGSNKSTGLDSYAQRQIANELDDSILSQLDDAAKAQFLDEKGKYKNYLAYRGATKAAYTDAGGAFSPKQYRNAAKKYGDSSTGNVPLDEISLPVRVKEASLPKLVKALKAKETADLAANKAKSSHSKLRQSQLARARSGYVEKAIRGATIENPSTGNKVVATAALGAIPSLMTGNLLHSVPTGAAIAKGLSSRRVQTAVAGQHQWQKDMAEALRRGDMAKYNQILARFGAGQATGE